ncbi:hypothetical protein [Sphingorhabdus sp.]|jgi:hypothetical protein|uniref:hypothetical protein n=1 Tax=Sphingorhabdus sp. TaxID=1902408 RepID=UPI00378334F3
MTHPIIFEIDSFIKANQMAESYFGRKAANDWKLVRQLRAGRRLWPDTEARIRTFMESYEKPVRGRLSHRSSNQLQGKV